ncbi:winged helix-turn-helix domain-containing protein [Serratia rubidaea]|uniref:winged helix-turn-helix domain-containing protein n=1 Tax=Serratia rubidaea TaxID=61652 RepID=UPI0022B8DA07|nr:winged helix-turn-helix domain-containing protein [Serratia rubidaea]WBF44096.1 winged helix-turn-helix domain-containing protein [Serratia rubidaea]
MKYRINGQILFDMDSGSLSLLGLSDEPLPISNPSKRLLLLLIVHQGEQVSRELIFRKVWDDYGMVSSNNNLNQCVSKLRRVLKTLGIEEEVIITVPKVGFMLSRSVAIECDDEMQDSVAVTRQESSDEGARNTAAMPSTAWRPKKRRHLRHWLWCGMATLLLSIIICVWLISRGAAERQEHFIGEVNGCKVFLSSSGTSLQNNAAQVNDILAYIAGTPAHCQRDGYLLVVNNRVGSYISGVSRLFILECEVAREHRIEFCQSYRN